MHFNIGLVLATIDDYPRAVSSKESFFPIYGIAHELSGLNGAAGFQLYNDTYPFFDHS